MNEQLVVKNFGPIRDATVDFKRVTVFIGPTGGGKSTLAKLAAVFRDEEFRRNLRNGVLTLFKSLFSVYESSAEITALTNLKWKADELTFQVSNNEASFVTDKSLLGEDPLSFYAKLANQHNIDTNSLDQIEHNYEEAIQVIRKLFNADPKALTEFIAKRHEVVYIPAERIFLAAIAGSLTGLMASKTSLPAHLLRFGRDYEQARKIETEYDLPLFGVSYTLEGGVDMIRTGDSKILLSKAASGIQSTLPMLLVMQTTSLSPGPATYIVEEPELNLFPKAQFNVIESILGYVNQKDDLVLTTHSPYVLTALNLLCYAFRIAQQDEATAKKVGKLIPRHCWIDPEQFAAYYVDRPGTKRKQQVRSIINKKTGLIEENELDTASDELSSIFDKLVQLHKPVKTPARATK